ncbi:YcjF family protein [Melittangium boletus]|uniref:GTPase n=1 Tax=Melittangium boletus DSM 14713 TaxID=1294270 RepID=A0A250IN52_9BACT|nr:DUF697 domain-containing protein [Melittangium boletus]ATB33175.1 hypothetical protein MEBOL_006664 [Melittangium boletus DSM 14713]
MSVETIQFEAAPQASAAEVKAPAQEVAGPVVDARERLRQAETIVYRNTFWAMGAGAIGVPLIDLVAASAVHLKQLKQLADLYGVDFKEGLARKLVAAMLMSLGGVGVGTLATSLLKLIPGIGTGLGMLSLPMALASSTNAIGQVFIMHFEAGGTLLDFNPTRMQDYFKSEFEKAQRHVAELKRKATSPAENKAS